MYKLFLFSLTIWFFISTISISAMTMTEAEKLFVHQVFPLLQAKCFVCHGDNPADIRGDLDLTSRQNMVNRQVLIPGESQKSRLYQSVTWQDKKLKMPPKANDRLTADQVNLIKQWIGAGAHWPEADRWQNIAASPWETGATGVAVKTSGGQTKEWSNRLYQPLDLWAFQPMGTPHPPTHELHPIDSFINQKLAKAKIASANKAGKLTLIRRATFDLTGLPPTPKEVDAFLTDDQPDAFERIVDRLLSDSSYGEQWGRQWLDVVRYADTSGFSNDFERPNTWRYRDYIIRSFNQDKPYDQFVREQLAGDEIEPTNPEMLIATGFLRLGPWEQTGMTIPVETRQFFLDDVTNAVGETFLSLPLRCARCHDHKFDPIPTKDYYRLQDIFAPLQFADRELAYLPIENQNGFESGRQRIQNLLDQAKADRLSIQKKEENAVRRWLAERDFPYQEKNQRKKWPKEQRPPRNYGLTYQDLGVQKALQKRIQALQWQLERYQPIVFSVYNGPWIEKPYVANRFKMPTDLSGDLPLTHVLVGGSIHNSGKLVSSGVLSAIGTIIPQPNLPKFGRRTQLAEWITNEENPFTSRSIVNRVWQHHFGRGLAGNANNFGKMGKKPTHPKLLDWLARNFVKNGWSIKKLHRQIMLSQTYQRSSHHPQYDAVVQKDPQNRLLAYFQPRRLRAEELRDSMLAVSGELNREMGGLPIYPEINPEVALQPRHIMGSIAPAYQPSATPAERHRRSIYAYRSRGLSDPMLSVFNQPPTESSCEIRSASTITPQAFSLFNGQNSRQRSLAMALRLQQEHSHLPKQINYAIRLAWSRQAQSDEIKRASDFIEKMTQYHKKYSPQSQTYPTVVERTMFEEMTGEAFTYTEQLDIYQNYVSDPQIWTVSASVRALADFCLILLNSNAFVYVY